MSNRSPLFSDVQSLILQQLGLNIYIRRNLPEDEASLSATLIEDRESLFGEFLHDSSSAELLDWEKLEADVQACRRCGLCEKRTQTVFGTGDREAKILFIGEAPGEQEDLKGQPFVGAAGQLLDKMLWAIKKQRSNGVYIANVLKCRPPGNRNPTVDEINHCESFLVQQIKLLKPHLIVLLGKIAAQTILKNQATIASMRRKIFQYQNIPVIVTYHPAYLLRNPGDKAKAWEDFCFLQDNLKKLS